MRETAFFFDMTACTGCHACEMACKDAHDLPPAVSYRTVRGFETGTYPTPGVFYYAGGCNHCENAPCIAACGSGAIRNDENGAVLIDAERCIGCGKCLKACPFGAIAFDREQKKAGKCDLCANLLADGEPPVCVAACPNRCLDFGPVEELERKYGPGLTRELPLFGETPCTPSRLVKPKPIAFAPDAREKRW
ncbi:MAG: 4Fe-4S dicluster domain-containing protein [Clostridia bacterium]|nr:4Fe-4S dicluster domain-containing protein [Clostridia bacterium]